MRFFLSSLLLLGAGALAAPAASTQTVPGNPGITAALSQMYNSQFAASRQSLSAYSEKNPADPLAYSLLAASYLFSELDRTGALSHSILKEDQSLTDFASAHVDTAGAAALNRAASLTRERAQLALAADPRDSNALLALCIVSGVQRDYLALVRHKLRESYEYIKESQDDAARLLAADPTAYDAYLSKGFTEYLVASLPFYLRWPMKLDNLSGTKQQGLSDLGIAANSGRYLKPFAQLLLAMFYLRENQAAKTQQILTQLAHDYPENPAFSQELHKLQARRQARD